MAKSKSKTIYVCQNCGAQRPRWEGKCSDCGSWNSFVEETQTELKASQTRGWSIETQKPTRLDESPAEDVLPRINTGIEEFNRVVGGGIPEGGFLLLGGSPGIGKSTLLLQIAGGVASSQKKVLYVSGEESVNQSISRAHRLGVRSPLIEMASESELNKIIEMAKATKPDVLVIDSIQTVFLSQMESAPGSVSQVRECAAHLMSLAKQSGIAVILVGHITKDGSIAGPKVLEHMVDCVLSFEGDSQSHFRLLKTIKNRFGGALEIGIFQMGSKGLEEVSNPSEMFLQERGKNPVGSVVFSSLEGNRSLLCEIQALSVSTSMAMPRRTSVGIEVNRVHLLTAVLERHAQIPVQQSDLYINVVGGLKISEPAVDLALAAAMISTERNIPIDIMSCFFGEVGLTGEVRGVLLPDLRVKEAIKLGLKNFYLPANQKAQVSDYMKQGLNFYFIKHIKELLNYI
jgi:DNA repair protein RadA/Sms